MVDTALEAKDNERETIKLNQDQPKAGVLQNSAHFIHIDTLFKLETTGKLRRTRHKNQNSALQMSIQQSTQVQKV